MHLNRRILKLVRAYHDAESDSRRGPRFKEVALALEQEMQTRGVTAAILLECFGPPDLWDEHGFVYFFDRQVAGSNRDEWFFHLSSGTVTSSAYNRRGINDLSFLKTLHQWPRGDV